MLALALLCLICSAAAEEQESAVEQKVEQKIPVAEPEIHEPTQEEEPAEAKAVEVEQKSAAATDTAVAADERTSADKGMGFLSSLLLIPLVLYVCTKYVALPRRPIMGIHYLYFIIPS